jgi:ribonuclease BN (tRNA processing enzyme)
VDRLAAGAPHLLAVSAAAGLGLLFAGSRRLARVWIFALVLGDLVLSNASINPTVDAAALAPFEWVEIAARHPQDRVFVSHDLGAGLTSIDDAAPAPVFPEDAPPSVHQAVYDTALSDSTSPWAVRQALSRDLTGLRPREYLTMLRQFTDSDRAARYRFLSWVGTRYYLVSAPPPIPATELARMPKLGSVALYESAPSGSRAIVVAAAVFEPDADAQIRRLFDPALDPSRTVIVDRETVAPSGRPGAPLPPEASVVEESTTQVVVEASAPEDAYLVLLDAYHPGWRVEVDGERAPLLRADGMFRAVRIAPGRHRIRFSFLPRSLVLGAAVSLLTALGLVSFVWIRRPGRIAAFLLLFATSLPVAAAADVKLVLLGTAGGPTPKKTRAAPAEALVIGDAIYLVDCGNGVGRQMALAGIPLRDLRHVFVTHHHSDHVADLVTLPLLAWAAGLDTAITLHGPPPLKKSVKAGLRACAFDAATRHEDEGRPRLDGLIRVHEFRGEGIVHQDPLVTVRAARVDHPPIHEAYAYRFDAAGWSVVISGDTAPSESLVRLAAGADVLVHEVLLYGPEEVAAWVGLPLDHPLVRHIVRSHTSFKDVGRIAREAGVRKLVLTHFVPGDAAVDRAAVLLEIRKSFDGEVVIGEDLLVIEPDRDDRR